MFRVTGLCIVVLISATSAFAAPEPVIKPFKAPEDIHYRAANFMSEGTRVQAELFSPKAAGEKKLPTIIMSHGWGGMVDGLRPDGVAFARAGFFVIAFDYRGWGKSDGRLIQTGKLVRGEGGKITSEVREVRGVVDPIDQTTDIMNAINWAQGHPQSDNTRIGLWGSSFSGGHVVYVSARDHRVKAFVSQVGSMDQRWVVSSPSLRKITYSQGVLRTQGKIGYPEPYKTFNNMRGEPVWEKFIRYAPIESIGRTKHVAKLFITAEKEELFRNADHADLAYKLAPGVKKLVEVKGIKHYGIYHEKRKEAQQLAIDWYNEHLKK